MDKGSLHPRERIRDFFASISSRYDLANHLLSAGCDFLWRRRAARLAASFRPARVLDLATGSGDLALDLERALPGSFLLGADFCPPMLVHAQRKGVRRLIAADGLRLPLADASFDLVTIAFGLRNMESWSGALKEVSRVLRENGRLLILDFSIPPPPLRWIYRPYLHRVLPLVAALVTGQRSVYQYLADSIEKFPSGEAMAALLEESGLHCREQISIQGGIVSIHLAQKRGT